MQTLSSARRTCMASASAVEWTATVWMPISRQARRMRSAISPRLAIRTFSNMGRGCLFQIITTWPNSTGLPSETRMRATLPALGALIWFITFIASMISSGLTDRDRVADPHEGGGPAAAER
jgi:hypothetical protein